MYGRNGESPETPEPTSLAYATENKIHLFKHGVKQGLTPKGWSPTCTCGGCDVGAVVHACLHTHTHTHKHTHTQTGTCIAHTLILADA